MGDEIRPETAIEWLRVNWKLWRASRTLCQSFCKKCGRDQRDFIAPESAWGIVEPHIAHGNVLCYDCFCEAHQQIAGYPITWKLVKTARK